MNAHAQIDIGNQFGSPFGPTYGIGDLVSTVVSFGITIASVLLLFLLIGGGVSIIASAGNNDPRAAAQGKQAVTWAIVGFMIVFTAFFVIRLIEVITGQTFITDPLGIG